MSGFKQGWALVPAGARWAAALAGLLFMSLYAALFLAPATAAREPSGVTALVFMFLLVCVFAVAPIVIDLLLVGYVYGDAQQRGMNYVMWMLLALLIPGAVGIILYFILREPLPVACPACGAPARKGHAFCPNCGTAVRAACPQCRAAVEPTWKNCAHCGAALQREPSGTAA
jgi:hypothetical protein